MTRLSISVVLLLATFTFLLATPHNSMAAVLPQQIAAGASYGVALKSNGTIWSWGLNDSGQLGNGTQADSSLPVPATIPTGSAFTMVSAGRSHTVALRNDGTVYTWGENTYGQLGYTTTKDTFTQFPKPQLTPAKVTATIITGVVAVAAGDSHTVVVKSDGTVWAWGLNYYGQLGNGTTTNSVTPVQVIGPSAANPALAVSAGTNHAIALMKDGTILAWGDNSSGQLGDGTTTQRLTPVAVSGLPSVATTPAVSVAVGRAHSVILLQDGSVWGWGDNSAGQLGDGTLRANSLVPTRATLTGTATAISAGSNNTMAIVGGTPVSVWSWGENGDGQLGNDTRTKSLSPVQVQGITAAGSVVMVATGTAFSMALKADGSVWAWGNNLNGQFGNGTKSLSSLPVQVNSITDATAIGAGDAHSLAALSGGNISGWGANDYGQLGTGLFTEQSSVPSPASAVSGAVHVTGGLNHSVALTIGGQVYTWGDNYFGQLGTGTATTISLPLPITALSGITAIAAGDNHSIALKSDGTVLTWGDNAFGQLGNGGASFSASPVKVNKYIDPVSSSIISWPPAGMTVKAIAAGGYRTVAALTDGSVWYWGVMGNGNMQPIPYPTRINGFTGINTVACGFYHIMGLKSDATVWAWGTNDYGELGAGTIGTTVTTPVQIASLTGITAIAAAGWHNLALRSDGTVASWGSNFSGERGNGTFTGTLAPTSVIGLSGITALAAGTNHSLALAGNGAIFAWGSDQYGQLGTGMVTIVPQQALINLTVSDIVAPTGGALTASPGNTRVGLSWSGFSDASSGIYGYKLVYATGAAPASCAAGTTLYIGPGTSYHQIGLTNGTAYYYRVCAYDNSFNISGGVTATATPQAALGVSITTTSPLPDGIVGIPYTQTLTATGGTPGVLGYSWNSTGPLPPNLTLNGAILSGMPQNPGMYTFPVTVSDPEGNWVTTIFTLKIIPVYTVTYNSNGGSAIAGQTVPYNTTATLPVAPTRTGYTFAGWFSDAALTTPFVFATPVTADIMLYAKWTANTYAVTFTSNGGSAVASQTVAYNTTATLPVAPTRTGYTFAGWFSDAALTTPFVFATPVTADITLYAKWTITSYAVTFTSNGGSAVAGQTVAYNTTATLPVAPTRTGYTFAGWFSDAALTISFSFTTAITADTTLYAKWTAATTRTNVALQTNGGVATASNAASASYPASSVNNGDRKGSVWGAGGGWYNGKKNNFPEWVQLQFNGQKSIDEVDIFSIQDAYASPIVPTTTTLFTKYGVTAFNVQYCTDTTAATCTSTGTGWATVTNGSITGNNLTWRTVTFPAVTTDRIRVQITATVDGYSRLAEVEAYGTSGDSVLPTTSTITWANPATITYGTPLSATQLNATASVPGTFSYTPASGMVLSTGTQTLSTTFTPTDTANYTSTTATVSLVVNKATPVISWANPAAITYGTALSTTQLNATASVPGTFSYTPTSGTVLSAGTQTLSGTFTPTDTANYTSTTATVNLVVNKVTSVITWASPAAVAVGTTLSATQLNATASVAGTFAYTPAAGTVLSTAGTQALSVTFTPKDPANYTGATTSLSLIVTGAVTRTNVALQANGGVATASNTASASYPASSINNGDSRGSVWGAGGGWYNGKKGAFPEWVQVQFNGQKSIDEIDVFSIQDAFTSPIIPTTTTLFTKYGVTAFNVQYCTDPTAATCGPTGTGWTTVTNGNVTGNNLVWRTFTFPAVTTDRIRVQITATLDGYSRLAEVEAYGTAGGSVVPTTPAITWANPAAITYGTPLSTTQLNATASVPGTFSYTPAGGMVLSTGTQTLSTTFTPTDTVNYTSATATVSLVVNKATPVITWANPAAITYGTALSATQLNATTSVPGTFSYTPANGSLLSTGTQTLSITFTPTDTVNYTSATATVSLVVNKATPVITWATPAAVTMGTSLSTTQLNATASVAGTFAYTPAAGTVLSAMGAQTLFATFTPSDTANYTTITASVSLAVNGNVALQANGGVATASNTASANYPASSVNNGDRKGSVWGAGGGWYNGKKNNFPEWVQVQFNGRKTISGIDVFSIQDAFTSPIIPTTTTLFTKYGVTAFNVQYCTDPTAAACGPTGTGWATVTSGSVTGNNLVWRTFTFPTVITDRIRVQITATLDGYSRLAEIEVSGY